MSEVERDAEVRRWLRYAHEDLLAAESILEYQGIASPRHACWLAQQSAEKALKTVMVFLQIEFPWRHDLEALRDLIPTGWRVKEERVDLAALTEWAVEAPYPGEWPDAKETDAHSAVDRRQLLVLSGDINVANQAVERANIVWASVSAELVQRGFGMEEPPAPQEESEGTPHRGFPELRRKQ